MFPPTQLTVKRKRGKLVVGFRSARIEDDALLAIVGRELLEICDIVPGSERRILLNFRGVEFISSGLIGKIVLMNKKAKARRISIRLSNVPPQAMRIFEVTRDGEIVWEFVNPTVAVDPRGGNLTNSIYRAHMVPSDWLP